VGKTNLHEFAFGTTNEESAYGSARHPLDPSRSPGGSSGGSAVSVATGMALASIGTDTGGSIRIPSAACGLVGLKPSLGEVETTGVVPLSWTLDHVGPLCRSVTDAAILLDVLRGTAPRPEITPKPSAVTLGIPRGYLMDRLDTEVAAAFAAACDRLRDAGVALRDVAIPHAADTGTVYLHIVLAEAAAYHGPTLDSMPESYHPDVRLRLEMARYVLAEDYARALRGRAVLTGEVDAALEGVDGLLLPSLAIPAPTLGTAAVRIGGSDEPIRNAMLRLTQLFNITGHPALTIPCGTTAAGLPVGAQIAGQRDRTGALLQVGRSVESAVWPDGFALATR
ncbi:MAG: amidase, partial [Vicinamibacterales bacterium]